MTPPSPGFLHGDTDCARRLRDLCWAASPLGEPADWPEPLQTLVSLMLGSQQPMLIAWGEDFIALYNDAHAALLGDRHPATLGQKLFDIWGDVAGLVGPPFTLARHGEPSRIDDLVIRIARGGIPVPAHFRISYSPIRDGSGVAGVLCLATETTESVLAERRRAALLELSSQLKDIGEPRGIVTAAVGTLGRHLAAQRVGYGEVQADDRTILLESCYVDGMAPLHGSFALDSFGAVSVAEQRRGLTVAHDDVTRTMDDPAQWQAIETRAFASVPLIRDGRLRATLYVNYREPHAWSAIELSLVEDVAAQIWEALERARAEEALRKSEALLALSEESLRLATEAAEIGIWDLDLAANVLSWSARTKAMFGISPEVACSMEDFYAGLHPEDRAATSEAFASAVDPLQRRRYEVEFRTIGKEDGVVRWVAAKGLGLFDAEGRCVRALGTAIDITARRAIDEQLRQAQESLAAIFNASSEGLALCRLIRDAAGQAVDYQVIDVNPAHRTLTGATRDQMLARPITQVAPPIDPRWISLAARAVESGGLQSFEVHSAATGRWLEIHMSPVADDVFAQTFIDVTGRRETEEQRVRLVAEMHHRVKNNFQMVASVLFLQSRRTDSAEARVQLESAQQRIQVLAELHDSLAASPDAGQVEFAAYLELLCDKLRGAADESRIAIKVRAQSAFLDVDIAVPLGFVVNELVTNALKYAFPAPACGEILVAFEPTNEGFVLRVSDNGQGLPEAAEVPGSGLGMRLVRSFVGQIGGTIEVERGAGVAYAIAVPATPDD